MQRKNKFTDILPLKTKKESVQSTNQRETIFYFSFPLTLMPAAILKNSIRRLRFEKSMTQEELALRTGVSRQTIMSIERGDTNPSVLLAFKISAALENQIVDVFVMEGTLVPV